MVCTVGVVGLGFTVTITSLRALSQPLVVTVAQYFLLSSTGMVVEANTSLPPFSASYHLMLDKVVRLPTVLFSDWQKVCGVVIAGAAGGFLVKVNSLEYSVYSQPVVSVTVYLTLKTDPEAV